MTVGGEGGGAPPPLKRRFGDVTHWSLHLQVLILRVNGGGGGSALPAGTSGYHAIEHRAQNRELPHRTPRFTGKRLVRPAAIPASCWGPLLSGYAHAVHREARAHRRHSQWIKDLTPLVPCGAWVCITIEPPPPRGACEPQRPPRPRTNPSLSAPLRPPGRSLMPGRWPTAEGRQPTAVGRQPTAVGRQPTAVGR